MADTTEQNTQAAWDLACALVTARRRGDTNAIITAGADACTTFAVSARVLAALAHIAVDAIESATGGRVAEIRAVGSGPGADNTAGQLLAAATDPDPSVLADHVMALVRAVSDEADSHQPGDPEPQGRRMVAVMDCLARTAAALGPRGRS